MVGPLAIPFLVVSMLLSVAVPAVLAVLVLRRRRTRFATVLAGAGVFVVFSFILEKIVHLVLLQVIPSTAAFLTGTTWIYALYGGLMAGLFEETGRLLAFLFVLKRSRSWHDGLGYGVGHGGMEAVLIGGLGGVNNLVFAILIATGTTDALAKQLPAETLAAIVRQFASTPDWMFLVSGFERILVLPVQIALSVLVLIAVKHAGMKRAGLFGLAVLLHAAIDVPAAFYQSGALGLLPVEGIVVLFSAAALAFTLLSRRLPAFRAEAAPVAPPETLPPSPPRT